MLLGAACVRALTYRDALRCAPKRAESLIECVMNALVS